MFRTSAECFRARKGARFQQVAIFREKVPVMKANRSHEATGDADKPNARGIQVGQ